MLCWEGERKRAYKHFRKYNESHLGYLIRKCDEELPVVKVREGLEEKDAFDTEVALITAIGRVDLKTGPLINHSGGGEGVRSPGPELREMIGIRFRGKPLSEQHKARINEALKGRLAWSSAGRLASPIAKPGVPLASEYIEKMRKSKIGKKWSLEARLNFSAARTGVPLSVEHRAAIGRGGKGVPKPTPLSAIERIRATMLAKKLRWWCGPDGIAYRSKEKRSVNDLPGRTYWAS